MGAKPVEIPSNQVSFHCKGILTEDKVTTSQFSQRKNPTVKTNTLKSFCYDAKSCPFLMEQLLFETHICGFLRFKTYPYGWHRYVPVGLHMKVTTPGY